jgi:hypothetical protein
MKPDIAAFAVCAIFSLLLTACQKAGEPPKPVTSDSGAASAPAAGGSVAAPPATVPPSDAAMKPEGAAAPSTSGDHNAATQATPKDLSKPEEKTAMPMPGQANDHSNTAKPSASGSSQK